MGLFSCIALFSVGCGGSAAGADAMVRFLQASPDAPLVNVLVDGTSVAGNLAYGNASGYISVKAGSRHIQVVPASGSTPIFDQTISFTSSTNQTLLLTGPAASIQSVLLKDGGTTATTGDGYVRVVNASGAMGAADVYIVPAGVSIVGVKPIAAGLAFDKDTGYQLTVAGNYAVISECPIPLLCLSRFWRHRAGFSLIITIITSTLLYVPGRWHQQRFFEVVRLTQCRPEQTWPCPLITAV